MKTKSRRPPAALATATSPPVSPYVLRLFVAGATARSRSAVLRVRALCAAGPGADCRLEVIDIYQQPSLARANQIVATPTLIREFPPPVRRFIGNLLHLSGLFESPAPTGKPRLPS